MAPDKNDQRYDPVPPIPTYDEAVAADSSRSAFDGSNRNSWQRSDTLHSPVDESQSVEGQSLLDTRRPFDSNASASTSRGRRPGGYRPPTVETDDEDDWDSSDTDSDGEAAHVRREMQELEVMDGEEDSRNRSTWGKRIGFSLSLPQWKWRSSWMRWRLPRLTIRLPRTSEQSGESTTNNETETPRRRFQLPSLGSSAAFMLVGRLLALLLVLGFIYLLFMSDLFTSMARRMGSQMFDPESVRIHVQSSVDARRIRDTLKHFTSYAHIAGTEGDYALAIDTKNMFDKYGLEDVTVDEFYVYLNYPKAGGRAVEILGADDQVMWSAKLEEEEVGGETAGRQTYVFHGHSKAGDVKGPLIYANYGSREDFKVLYDSGIDTRGAIALVRQYGPHDDQAIKVKAAEMAGFAGCIIYSDPADDGFLRGETAPKGRFMPADGVQRGSVSLSSWVVGDVLTPGWGSKMEMPRMTVDQTPGLVKIPSIPLAWRDAQALLEKLQGAGQPVPDGWKGGVPDVKEWWTGNLSSSPVVHLRNEQDEAEKQPIWNVYGRIAGVEQREKKILIGNHRDSWSFGSADPHSGTAVMMEVVRIFGDLVARGWRPLRTIEFMSWDAEEYNNIGSTEYVEQNDKNLKKDALAYINLDDAVTGDTFHASGSPVFRKLLLQILNRVGDPNFNTTLRDLWDTRKGDLEGLGAGSDYVAFQDIVGTSSLDISFESDEKYPAYSSYENFEWMERVGDPGFTYHVLLGQVLGLLVLELADRPIMPFDMAAYADSLYRWVDDIVGWSENKGLNQEGKTPVDVASPLREAADEVAMAVRQFDKWELDWESTVVAASGWEPNGLGKKRCEYNSRMARFETDLLDDAGVPNRTQFKHVIFGPDLWSPDDAAYFPSIRDTILAGDWQLANKTVTKVAGIIKQAAVNLAK
ncbi:hypothetical protein QBC46DRAFT_390898 [Diplogelasinospora grovesii]|uniref:Uncharacterized protein n=1 Tax=Diplogelasinospora grovesii TaxID=303347 RepID=A0AAN6N699_9PEZI|nr:hypothetical protein QBC46DRAFT_390898 [Diplogelasinospora grovesii]